MLQIYYGDGTAAKRALHKESKRLIQAENEGAVTRMDEDNFATGVLDEAIMAANLFMGSNVIVLDRIGNTKEGLEFIKERCKDMVNSPHSILMYEEKIAKALFEVLKKSGATLHEFTATPKAVRSAPTIFAISDAYTGRDKKSAWIHFQKLIREGSSAEEIHGTLFWAVKSLAIVSSMTQAEAEKIGVKPFTYSKSKQALRKWGEDEVGEALSKLKEMYHKAHRGIYPLDIALERFLLD